MAHEPILTVYRIRISPRANVEDTNRWLFRNIINEANQNDLEDRYVYTQLFRMFIAAVDREEMYMDERNKKSFTANQRNIEDGDVDTNISFSPDNFIIQGVVEGGAYGKKRNKTSTLNKQDKDTVREDDAITDNFFFLLYMPPESNKMILMLQSYTGDTIDSVFKHFFESFFQVNNVFWKPKIERYIPESIVNDFRDGATVSSIKLSSVVPGQTLLDIPIQDVERNFKVTVTITPEDQRMTQNNFAGVVERVTNYFRGVLGNIDRRSATLNDQVTGNPSTFDIDDNFSLKPIINLSKFIQLNNDERDFDLIKRYCNNLLNNELINQIYNPHGIE